MAKDAIADTGYLLTARRRLGRQRKVEGMDSDEPVGKVSLEGDPRSEKVPENSFLRGDSFALPEEGVQLIQHFLQIRDSAVRMSLVRIASELARIANLEKLC